MSLLEVKLLSTARTTNRCWLVAVASEGKLHPPTAQQLVLEVSTVAGGGVKAPRRQDCLGMKSHPAAASCPEPSTATE
jgi:hypothetical protein